MCNGTPTTTLAAIRDDFDASDAAFEEALALVHMYARGAGQAGGLVDAIPVGIDHDGFGGEYDRVTIARLHQSRVAQRGDRLIEFAHEIIRLVEV